MPRPKRLKLENQVAHYHIISRTVGKEFLINRKEKDKLMELIKHYSSIYFVDVISFSLMDNHFHLLIQFNPENRYSNQEVSQRIRAYLGHIRYKFSPPSKKEFPKFRKNFSDLSKYVRDIKQSFASWYNRKNKRFGHFWGERFKSVIFEPGENLLNCMLYIDLNPVRAGIVRKPEEYRWSSAGYRYGKFAQEHFLSFNGVFTDSMTYREKSLEYYGYLKGKESEISDLNINFQTTLHFQKVPFYTNGLVVGSSGFIEKISVSDPKLVKKTPILQYISKTRKIFSLKKCFP